MIIHRDDIKLIIRYIVILYLIYLSNTIIHKEWLTSVTYLSHTTLAIFIGSVYGALSLVLKAHFKHPISNEIIEGDRFITKDIKIASRYLILFYFMYMITYITDKDYIYSIKDIGDTAINTVVGSIYGALVIVLGSHFEFNVSDTNIPNNSNN